MMRLSALFLLGIFMVACGAEESSCGSSSGSAATQLSLNASATGYIPEVEPGCSSGGGDTEKCDLLTNPSACQSQ